LAKNTKTREHNTFCEQTEIHTSTWTQTTDLHTMQPLSPAASKNTEHSERPPHPLHWLVQNNPDIYRVLSFWC